MKYERQQMAWPTASASLVESRNYAVPVISGWPTRPYEIVGFLKGSITKGSGQFQGGDGYAAIGYLIGRGFRSAAKSDDPLAGIAAEAKKHSADAVVVLSSEREFAGFASYQSGYTSPTRLFGAATTVGTGPMAVTTMHLEGGASRTESWGATEPRYTDSFTAIAIRYVDRFPEEQYMVAGQRLTAHEMVASFYRTNPDLVGRELLVGATSAWVGSPEDENWDEVLTALAAKVRVAIRQEAEQSVTGTWYGYMTQTTVGLNGARATSSSNVQITLTQSATRVLGNGTLSGGETISFQGEIGEGRILGSLINTTYGLKSSFSAATSATQMTGDFSGEGDGRILNGIFTVYR